MLLMVMPSGPSSTARFRASMRRALARAVRREVRERLLFVYRADVDDPSLPLRGLEMADQRLRGEEGALHVHIHHFVVVRFGNFPERSVDLDAVIVDQDIELAELGNGIGDHLGNICRGADVGPQQDPAPSRCDDVGQGFLGRGLPIRCS